MPEGFFEAGARSGKQSEGVGKLFPFSRGQGDGVGLILEAAGFAGTGGAAVPGLHAEEGRAGLRPKGDHGKAPEVQGDAPARLFVPQGDPLMEELSAWDNLRMWYDRKTLERELSGGALKMLGIDSFLKTPVRRMSGGMKKRLSIGCAVVSHPGILVLDEPSAALDPVCKENIRSYLNVYRKEGGIVLVATHDAQDLELCDMCYILRDGTLHRWQYGGDFHKLAEELCEKNF